MSVEYGGGRFVAVDGNDGQAGGALNLNRSPAADNTAITFAGGRWRFLVSANGSRTTGNIRRGRIGRCWGWPWLPGDCWANGGDSGVAIQAGMLEVGGGSHRGSNILKYKYQFYLWLCTFLIH